MQFKDYYKILGVKDDADLKSIKTAYRKLARKYHPDVSEDKESEEKFKEVAEAYTVLKDTEKRAEYDELRQYAQHGQQFKPPPDWQSRSTEFNFSDAGMSDFFQSIFGRAGAYHDVHDSKPYQEREQRSYRGQDVEIEMPIFLEDTINDKSKTVNYEMPHYDLHGRPLETIKKNIQVKIPKGIHDGAKIRVPGQGAPGWGKAASGDLYLHIRLVPHPLYDVDGKNLNITVPIAPWEAALGAVITVPTLQGKIKLNIPENSQSGQRLRIKGRGLPSRSETGDLYAILKVVMPQEQYKSNPELKKLWTQMAQHVDYDPRIEWS